MSVAATRSRDRKEIDDKYKWNLVDIFPNWETWQEGYDKLEAHIEKYAAFKGTLKDGGHRLLEAFQMSDELGQLAYRVWYLPFAAVRRRSARQHDQREASAGADAVRAVAAGAVVVQPRAARHPARDGPRLDGAIGTAASVSLRDRRPLPAAGTRARRGGRAADVALEPPRLGAERSLLVALDRGREVSRRSRCRPAKKSPSPTGSTAPSSRRGANRQTARRRFARSTRPTTARSTPTRRSTTASASATGSRLAPAATRARSKRHCTATTSRPRLSRT